MNLRGILDHGFHGCHGLQQEFVPRVSVRSVLLQQLYKSHGHKEVQKTQELRTFSCILHLFVAIPLLELD
jgi:hypothetical protein